MVPPGEIWRYLYARVSEKTPSRRLANKDRKKGWGPLLVPNLHMIERGKRRHGVLRVQDDLARRLAAFKGLMGFLGLLERVASANGELEVARGDPTEYLL
jgi:hypothetical protein